jgi:hypothetical protein
MNVKRAIRRGTRLLLTAAAAAIVVLLVTGCGSGNSPATAAHQLLQEFPWLGPLGLSFIENLLIQYGSNLAALLAAAAAALLG